MGNGQGLVLMQTRLGTALEGSSGFNPANLIAIIQAVLAMLGYCPSPTPAKLRRRLGNRAMLACEIHARTACGLQNAFGQSEICFDQADKATDEELQKVIDDAQ